MPDTPTSPSSPSSPRTRPVVLVILDGFGEREESADNAVRLAKTPQMDALKAAFPHSLISTSGPDVGLPPGQMGNSEVGHLNFGAGRIAQMDISRIDVAMYDGTLKTNAVLHSLIEGAKARGGKLHLCGLVSDGGVHSMNTHLHALIEMAHAGGVQVVVHAFLDGRDVQPGTAPGYLKDLEAKLAEHQSGVIGTVHGRYWAMDRDNRWDRVQRAYEAIVHGKSSVATQPSALAGVEASYAAEKFDEFVEPFVVAGYAGTTAADACLHFNFRPDRARELTHALATPDFTGFDRGGPAPFDATRFACMTTYDRALPLPVAFPKEQFSDIFPEVIARRGLTQFRCAETEKYAHITYFFNGGREEPFAGEERVMIPSDKKVATYDEKPEMSEPAVAEAVVKAIESDRFDFVLVNFANPDMVGHTGKLGAAVEAVEAVDDGVGKIVAATRAKGGCVFVTADHGNCELMKDPASGKPHTSHTTFPVPLMYINDHDARRELVKLGRICDVAPTMLELLGVAQPAAMTGRSLFAAAGEKRPA